MNSMRPPVSGIDEAYFCAKAEQASRDAAGGTVIPTTHLETALDTLDGHAGKAQTILEAALRAQFRKTVHRAMQSGEQAVPLSVAELQALAALIGGVVEIAPPAELHSHDNVLPFPAPLQPDVNTYAEPA